MTKDPNISMNPWPGISSYKEPTKGQIGLKFCGRDNDIYDMTRLIDDNLLVILYGKSGIGKTSLLNAGVFPELRKDYYVPVSIRLGSFDSNVSYQKILLSAIEKAISENGGNIKTINVVEKKPDETTQDPDYLWNYFARHHFLSKEGQSLFPVIVLDQFEEVLRYSNEENRAKANALLSQIQYLSDESHALSDCIIDGEAYSYDFNFRFVIAIREDELYLLEDSTDKLAVTSFKRCRYRLRSLSLQSALDAIHVPGNDCIEKSQMDDISNRIIELSQSKESQDIDTLLLSMVCACTFDKKTGEKICLSDLKVWDDNPMETYYHDAIRGLAPDKVRYIQQHLIREDGTRKRVEVKEAKTKLGDIDFHTLTEGKNRILSLTEHEQVELMHDQLGLAVFEDRKAFEERERKKIIRQRGTIITSFVFFILGIFFFQNQNLKQQRWKMMESQSGYIGEKAIDLMEEGNFRTAYLLLLDVLPSENQNKPITPEAELALREDYEDALEEYYLPNVHSAIFSPDGRHILSTTHSKSISLWKYQYGEKSDFQLFDKDNSYEETNHQIIPSISPDGHRIASSSNKIVNIWDVETGKIIRRLMGHVFAVNFISFDPIGKYIVSASDDKTVKIWDIESGRLIHTLIGHTDKVNSAAFSPDGKRVVSASNDRTVRIWDVESGQQIKLLTGHSLNVNSAVFSPNGKNILTTCDDWIIRIWDIESEQLIKTFEGSNGKVKSAVYNPSGNHILSTTSNGKITLWDTYVGSIIHTYNGYNASFGPDGKQFIAVRDTSVIIWRTDLKQKRETVIKGQTGIITNISFNPNGERIVSASNDSMIRIWDVRSGLLIDSLIRIDTNYYHELNRNRYRINSSDSTMTLTIINNNLKLEISKTRQASTLLGHRGNINSASFSPDNKYIVSASSDSTLRIWDVESGLSRILEGHRASVNSAFFSPDGKYIISASDDNTVRIWNTDSRKTIHISRRHKDNVNCAVFSPDGKHIASASNDSTIIIWSFPTLKELISQTRERFQNDSLTTEERRLYYLER